jgi:hypothetical protein
MPAARGGVVAPRSGWGNGRSSHDHHGSWRHQLSSTSPSRAAGGLLRPSDLLRSELGMGTPRALHLPSNQAQQRQG